MVIWYFTNYIIHDDITYNPSNRWEIYNQTDSETGSWLKITNDNWATQASIGEGNNENRRKYESDLLYKNLIKAANDGASEYNTTRTPVSINTNGLTKVADNKYKISIKKVGEYYVLGPIKLNGTNNVNSSITLKTTRQIQKIMEDEMQKMADKGRIGRKIRVMIVGIPNVGKSSFINRIAKKTSAEVGNKPGVTKQKQWIRINEKIELLDTPGVLWPKFENEKVAMNLAITGTIKDDILELTEVAYTLTKFMLENYRNNLLQRYSLDEKQINEILNQEQAENENIYEIMQLIGKKRGAILGGRVDDERTSKLILDDFRSSKLGKITLEIPE